MNRETLIENTLVYVKDFFKDDYSGHDNYHTLRVYKMAKKIGEQEKVDMELVLLSALLHDVDDYKLVSPSTEPFYHAKTFLRTQDLPEERISKICHIISQISFKADATITPDTIEGQVVQDADRLDALGAIAIARTFAYGGSHNRPIYIPELETNSSISAKEYTDISRKTSSIHHFYEKLLTLKDLMNTKTAKEIAIHRHAYIEGFLEEFFNEWNGLV